MLLHIIVYNDPYVDERTIKSLGKKNNSIRKWFAFRYSINECTSEQSKKYDCFSLMKKKCNYN